MKRSLDHHVPLGQLAAVGQLDRDRDAGIGAVLRVRHARDGELVLARKLLGLGLVAFRFAAGLARLPAPSAVAGHVGELLGRDADRNRMRLRQHIVFFGRAPGILALAHRRVAAWAAIALVASLAQGLRRPTQAALLITFAGRGGATVGMRSVLAVGIIEIALGAPDHVGRKRRRRIATHCGERRLVQREGLGRLEEPEWSGTIELIQRLMPANPPSRRL